MIKSKVALKNIAIPAVVILILIAALSYAGVVFAEEAGVRFGSNWYEPPYNGRFPIGVYIESAGVIGEYELVLSYDTRYLKFLNGATENEEGRITISGNMQSTSSKYMLNFQTIAVGETSLRVESAVIKSGDGTQEYTVAVLPETPIHIQARTVLPFTGMTINGTAVEEFSPEVLEYEMQMEPAEEFQAEVAGAERVQTELNSLSNTEKELYISAVGSNSGTTIYTIHLHITNIRESEENAEKPDATGSTEASADGEESMNHVAQSKGPSAEELQSILEKNRQRSMIKAGMVLCALAVIIGFIFLGLMRGRERLGNGRRSQKKKEKTGKDIMFDSLDSDEK